MTVRRPPIQQRQPQRPNVFQPQDQSRDARRFQRFTSTKRNLSFDQPFF